jgi:tRNA-specific 2-thiouridylase
MDQELFEHHLSDRSRRGAPPSGSFTGSAGGAPCGDLARVSLLVSDARVDRCTFDASGCAAMQAAAAAAAELAEGLSAIEAARISVESIADELGGLPASRLHAAELAADALHRALSAAAGERSLRLAEPGPNRVLVAMSGGVDSAVAALLEREAGREVVTVTLKLWADERNDGERSCCSPEAVRSARALAHSLGLPHLTLDLRDPFRAGVVDPFLAGHVAGETPNPCVLCNGEVRIDAMIDLADRLGAASLVTGHYARVVDDGDGPLLSAAEDSAKDQTYMLSGLAPASLAKLRFPLAGLTKPQVRALAAEAGLAVAGKAESQDLCFLAGEGKRAFLRRNAGLDDRPGDVVDRDGRRLGVHPGHHNFTVGQRRGLGVAAGDPLFVLATDAATNQVVAGPREELAARRVRVRGAVLHRDGGRVDTVRLRYRSKPVRCSLPGNGSTPAAGSHEELELELAEPVYGVAPGQTAALMDGELIVGRATIAGAA